MRSRFEFFGVKVRYVQPYRPRQAKKFLDNGGIFLLLPDDSIGITDARWFRSAVAEFSRRGFILARAMSQLGAIDHKTFITHEAEYLRRKRHSEAEDAASTIEEHAKKIGLTLTARQQRTLSKITARAA